MSSPAALDLYGLSDVNPAKIDITVPRTHRIRREIPASYRIHHEDLPEGWTVFEGIPIVTPARAIRQAHAAHLGAALVDQPIDHGARNGRLTRREADELRRELAVKRGTGVRRWELLALGARSSNHGRRSLM